MIVARMAGRLAWLGLALSWVGVLPGTAWAYTPEQQQACSGDAFRLCSSEIPDIDRITGCMIRNKAQLSPECRAHFRPEPEVTPAVARTPANPKPAIVRSKPKILRTATASRKSDKAASAKRTAPKPAKPRTAGQ